MQVQAIYIYPIKGMKGISVSSASCLDEGFRHDRRWMLVDDEGKFCSQRTHPRLALFHQVIDSEHVQVSYQGDQLSIPLRTPDGPLREVMVFKDIMLAREGSKAASEWFSRHLGQSVHLVAHGPNVQRVKEFPNGRGSTLVSFVDGYPYLILGTASLAELNRRLDNPLPINRFRPNLVIDTSHPHEEDDWGRVQIGSVFFEVIKPSFRCQVTTIDQESAQRGMEPLRTLVTYRKTEKGVKFGAYAVSLEKKEVKVGDMVVPGAQSFVK